MHKYIFGRVKGNHSGASFDTFAKSDAIQIKLAVNTLNNHKHYLITLF